MLEYRRLGLRPSIGTKHPSGASPHISPSRARYLAKISPQRRDISPHISPSRAAFEPLGATFSIFFVWYFFPFPPSRGRRFPLPRGTPSPTHTARNKHFPPVSPGETSRPCNDPVRIRSQSKFTQHGEAVAVAGRNEGVKNVELGNSVTSQSGIDPNFTPPVGHDSY